MSKLQIIIERYNLDEVEVIYYPDFDDAILGFDADRNVLIYSMDKAINIIMDKYNLEFDDAMDHFYFNVHGSYLGENTPIWCDDAI